MWLVGEFTGETLQYSEDAEIGAGGEARVFALPQDAARVIKIYHHPTHTHLRKLQAMVATPPIDPRALDGMTSIAWPRDLLYTMPERQFVGYLMPRVSGTYPICDVYNPSAREQVCPRFSYRDLVKIARALAETVEAIHAAGYVIGDLSESNILVSESALITVVDTDSFQVSDPLTGEVYRCPVGKPEFTPPEMQSRDFSLVDRRQHHDVFGLAVLLFHLLMEGWHPFLGHYAGASDPPVIAARIAAGHFPYARRRMSPCRPPLLAPPFILLHPTLQYLFLLCFEEGHTRPTVRPTAHLWLDALCQAEAALVPCALYPRHWYGNHLEQCPWCERIRQFRGHDNFPAQGKLLTFVGEEEERASETSESTSYTVGQVAAQWAKSLKKKLRREE